MEIARYGFSTNLSCHGISESLAANQYNTQTIEDSSYRTSQKSLVEVFGEKVLAPIISQIGSTLSRISKYSILTFPGASAAEIKNQNEINQILNEETLDSLIKEWTKTLENSKEKVQKSFKTMVFGYLTEQINEKIKVEEEKLTQAKIFNDYSPETLDFLAGDVIADAEKHLGGRPVKERDPHYPAMIDERLFIRYRMPIGSYTQNFNVATKSKHARQREDDLLKQVKLALSDYSQNLNKGRITELSNEINRLKALLEEPWNYIPPQEKKQPIPLSQVNVDQLVGDSESYTSQIGYPYNYYLQSQYIATQLCNDGDSENECYRKYFKYLSSNYGHNGAGHSEDLKHNVRNIVTGNMIPLQKEKNDQPWYKKIVWGAGFQASYDKFQYGPFQKPNLFEISFKTKNPTHSIPILNFQSPDIKVSQNDDSTCLNCDEPESKNNYEIDFLEFCQSQAKIDFEPYEWIDLLVNEPPHKDTSNPSNNQNLFQNKQFVAGISEAVKALDYDKNLKQLSKLYSRAFIIFDFANGVLKSVKEDQGKHPFMQTVACATLGKTADYGYSSAKGISGAVTGALLGAPFGPYRAAAGAIIGGVVNVCAYVKEADAFGNEVKGSCNQLIDEMRDGEEK